MPQFLDWNQYFELKRST